MVAIFKKGKKWQDIEYFNEDWKKRISLMAGFIDKGSSVMDLGCGKMWLHEFLPANCRYIPVDYIQRSPECMVADFNKSQFPDTSADTAFISGCLEYIRDYKWFLTETASRTDKIILSYCTIELFPDKAERKSYHWVNHLSADEIIDFLSSLNFSLQHSSITKDRNHIFIFARCRKMPVT
ncbi:MAG: hypothetical protein JNN00_10120 [Chitinophagaceae bacterium]|nr:hypothetical protein [Chitinophagaceae bacterium]